MPDYSDVEIIKRAESLANDQFGGTLATIHSDDGTPYPTFVLFQFTKDVRILFGSSKTSQHVMDVTSTPEVSFLIDNRNILYKSLDVTSTPEGSWHLDNQSIFAQEGAGFDRVIVEGMAVLINPLDSSYIQDLDALTKKNWLAGFFARQGGLYGIRPRRLTLVEALDPVRYTVDF